MARKPICPHCLKEVLPSETTKKSGGRAYHIACYKIMIQEKYEQGNEEIRDKQELYDYIKEIYKTNELDLKIKAQIDKYHDQFELSYRNIYLSLFYYYSISQNVVSDDYGIGIVPYIAKEAELFFKTKRYAEEINKGKRPSDYVTNRVVYKQKNTKQNFDMINIDDL